jgi:hypothetical protein
MVAAVGGGGLGGGAAAVVVGGCGGAHAAIAMSEIPKTNSLFICAFPPFVRPPMEALAGHLQNGSSNPLVDPNQVSN